MTTSVEIDDELTGRIENLAKAKQRPTNWVVQKAIEDYIAREEKRESFNKMRYKHGKIISRMGCIPHLPRHMSGWLDWHLMMTIKHHLNATSSLFTGG